MEMPWFYVDPGAPALGTKSMLFLAQRFRDFNPSKFTGKKAQKRFAYPINRKRSIELMDKTAYSIEREFKRCIDNLKSDVLNYGFEIPAEVLPSSLKLGDFPWLESTWDCLISLGFDQMSYLVEIEGLTWGEIYSASDNPERTILDILQMTLDWATFMDGKNLELTKCLDIDALVTALEVQLSIRTGSYGEANWNGAGVLPARGGWGQTKKTLDTLGDERGITRERLRQIEVSLNIITESRRMYFMTDFLKRMYEMASAAKPTHAFNRIKSEFNLNDYWTVDTFLDFIETHFSDTIFQLWSKCLIADATDLEVNQNIISIIRKSRNDLGVIKLKVLTESLEGLVDNLEIIEYVNKLYPTSFIFGDYAIVARKGEAGFIRNLSQQLYFEPQLHIDQLLKGLQLEATFRNALETMPDRASCIGLIKQFPNFTISDDFWVQGPKLPPTSGTQVEWIAQQISEAPNQIISKTELFDLAMKMGHKVATVSMFLAYSPIFRQLGQGLYTLVGKNPPSDVIGHALRLSKALSVPSTLKLQSASQNEVVLNFTLGTTFINSGTIGIPASILKLIGSEKYDLTCCTDFSTKGGVLLRKSTLIGVGLVRDHLLKVHSVSVGNTIGLVFNTDKMNCSIHL